ncbi:amidohydrolase family protein [Schumannella luteola]|uniref:Amidohydrolase-related domain-containing protein n=1 Tax=Schumannella luteola TaxID=472059 RepID=A0A852Y644_9MICO|nr:amidohydrolase family protein [Schumannella luteola]NYG98416.1 hypothetical protein [Schumannella luteola]TPX01347.1 amidohydrolase [Schumannella luteola]
MTSTDANPRATTIAVEEHWMPGWLEDALGRLPDSLRDESLVLNHRGDESSRLTDLGAGRVAAMDAAGVDLALVSLTPPGIGPLAPAEAIAMSRAVNDAVTDAVRAHPDRLRALASLPLAAPDAVVAELERAVAAGAVGVMVHGRIGDRALDDPAYDGFWDAATQLGTPVSIHPQIAPAGTRADSYSGFDDIVSLGLATFGWGWHIEAATAALRLMLRGTFDRHPDLQIVLGHWGELLPFWSDRTNSLARAAGLDRSISDYVRDNVVITNSGMMSPTLLRHALEITTPDRIVYSTDYPFQRPSASDLDELLTCLPDDDARTAFRGGNAQRLYRLRDLPPGEAESRR